MNFKVPDDNVICLVYKFNKINDEGFQIRQPDLKALQMMQPQCGVYFFKSLCMIRSSPANWPVGITAVTNNAAISTRFLFTMR